MKKIEQTEVIYIKQTTALVMAVLCLLIGFGVGVLFVKMTTTTPVPTMVEAPVVSAGETPQPVPAPPNESHHETAIQQLQQLLAQNPKNAPAWADLGNHFFDMNRYAEAINAYSKHLELNPNNADVLTDMGIMYRLSKKPEEAIACFDKAITANPNHPQARFNKGVVLIYDLQKKEPGLAVWRELLAINPNATAPNGEALAEILKKIAAPEK